MCSCAPRLDTPVFAWESEDGSRVNAVSLPAEYTTWFHDPTVKNINVTLERTKQYDRMVCCYGVGNHGGGPTIENIQSIQTLENGFSDAHSDVHLKFQPIRNSWKTSGTGNCRCAEALLRR